MRLITRADFDGLVCAVLLEEIGIIDSYKFVHPKVIQDGLLEITENDVIANMPYAPGCGLWFDHHASEQDRLDLKSLDFEGDSRPAPSAAQVVWDYYGGLEKFDERFMELLEIANRFDAAVLTRKEITQPSGWILICFLLDPRSGLGRVTDFRIGSLPFMINMIRYCRRMSADDILKLPDVKERADLFFRGQEQYKEMLLRCTEAKGNILIVNLLEEENIHPGNRFLSYALFPDQNIELRLMWGVQRRKVVISCGHSILNRTSRTHVGQLMLKYGGGGHLRVGSCQIETEGWEKVFDEIVTQILKDG